MSCDPFSLLGLDRSASVADLRAARRRLAQEFHPDRGGDGIQMREINAAFEAAVAHATGRRPLPDAVTRPPADGRAPGPGTTPGGRRSGRRPERRRSTWSDGRRVEHDFPSFVIEALPAEAFEALLVVASWMGEVLVDEPPYVLEIHLHDPGPCWCRLDLVPDAGSSTVSLTVVAIGEDPVPPVEAVRDAWVANLNRL